MQIYSLPLCLLTSLLSLHPTSVTHLLFYGELYHMLLNHIILFFLPSRIVSTWLILASGLLSSRLMEYQRRIVAFPIQQLELVLFANS